MKGAIIATQNKQFIDLAASVLLALNYNVLVGESVLQITDGDRLLTFDNEMCDLIELIPDLDEYIEGKLLSGNFLGCSVECRWEDLFCRVMKDIATHGSASFLIIDNSGAVLDPSTLDPGKIHL